MDQKNTCEESTSHSSEPKGSFAKVMYVSGRSRIVECQSVSPVRLLHPYLSDQAVLLMMSSYGGGMVQGDHVEIDFECGEGARVLIGTQANSRVYRNDRQLPTSQAIRGRVEAGGQVVVLPEPLVLHAGSRFHQKQRWTVEPGGSLLLAEWFQCGRSDSGECFSYQGYQSDIEIWQAEELLLWEQFCSDPEEENPGFAGRFGNANLMLNLFAVGDAQGVLQEALQSVVDRQSGFTQVPSLTGQSFRNNQNSLRSLVTLEDRPLTIFRSLGRTRMDFDDILEPLQQALATDTWLGKGITLPVMPQVLGQ